MRKRTCFLLYVLSCYAGLVAIILLASAPHVWFPWGYGLLAMAIGLWLRFYARIFRRPKDRPGEWSSELELKRHRTKKDWDS